MAIGITDLPKMHPVKGFKLGTTKAGIKYKDRKDLVLMAIAEGSTVAATFTRNAFCAAPVLVSKENIQNSPTRYLLINTGSANAGTGAEGIKQANECCKIVADYAKTEAPEVLPFSTGVIGELLPIEKISRAIPSVFEQLSENGWHDAATGIMTTDTVPKGASEIIEVGGKNITITGISKGAGMIRPNMATMLAFIATDAVIKQELLQKCLSKAVKYSFNKVTVDGDTSTNDSCILAATGTSDCHEITAGSKEYILFEQAIHQICQKLAQAIIRDGEGATKFITINIESAKTETEAEIVAYTIAHSPLVKTAFFASDPNWGRLLAAIGRAEIDEININKISLFIGDTCLIRDGEPAAEYIEAAGQKEMNAEEITVRVDLGQGDQCSTVWTCDFSYDYVKINAEYRS